MFYFCWPTYTWNCILCVHNSKLFCNFNFPPNQKKKFSKNHELFWPVLLVHTLLAPDQQKSGIWGNLAKISHQFLRMEREDVINFWNYWTVHVVDEGNLENLFMILNVLSSCSQWKVRDWRFKEQNAVKLDYWRQEFIDCGDFLGSWARAGKMASLQRIYKVLAQSMQLLG